MKQQQIKTMCVCEHLFYTNVNAWVYTCVCERACVHKVPPCKCLIVCVGNNSPIPQGMKQAWKRPGPQTSRDPQGTGPQENHRRDNRGLHPEKGGGEPEGGTSDKPQCRRPRVPWRQARRLHRQPTIPGRTGPWARRPKGPHPTIGAQQGSRARPRHIDRREWAGARPSILPGARNHQRTGGILHRQGMVVGWGSTKMMSEAESKARPDT